MNAFGRHLRVTLFGESHGQGVGAVVDGLPPGTPVDERAVQAALDARRPGGRLASQRREPDRVAFLSGVLEGHATGAPLALWIANQDVDSRPYERQALKPRPGHADFTQWAWSRGHADLRGGGHASGRLTAPLVAAAALAQPLLAAHGIAAAAHLAAVGTLEGPRTGTTVEAMQAAMGEPVPTAHGGLAQPFAERIEAARKAGDSVGGVVAFTTGPLPVGLGAPFFDSMESQAAHLLFAIPAVKGVEFGQGFAAARMEGSAHNDPFAPGPHGATTTKNDGGGILGGRTTGAPVWGRVAFKPSSSIFTPQATVDLATGKAATLELTGRHDPCIAVRGVPVVAAAVRLVLADFVLQARLEGHLRVPEAT